MMKHMDFTFKKLWTVCAAYAFLLFTQTANAQADRLINLELKDEKLSAALK